MFESQARTLSDLLVFDTEEEESIGAEVAELRAKENPDAFASEEEAAAAYAAIAACQRRGNYTPTAFTGRGTWLAEETERLRQEYARMECECLWHARKGADARKRMALYPVGPDGTGDRARDRHERKLKAALAALDRTYTKMEIIRERADRVALRLTSIYAPSRALELLKQRESDARWEALKVRAAELAREALALKAEETPEETAARTAARLVWEEEHDRP
jgi:hypothetical protein